MAMSSIGRDFNSMLGSFYTYMTEKVSIRYILLALFVGLGGVGAYFGYQWYDARKQQAAQFEFGVLLDQFNAALEQDSADFNAIAEEFARGYARHRSTHVAPYFASLEADALVKGGNKEQAFAAMNRAVNTQSDLKPLFEIKRALLALDSGNTEREQEGLAQLKELANQEHNKYRDYALYHLGMYHWIQDDANAARLT